MAYGLKACSCHPLIPYRYGGIFQKNRILSHANHDILIFNIIFLEEHSFQRDID